MLFFFFFFNEESEEYKEVKLSTLFEIFSGLLDDGSEFYTIDKNDKEVILTMLRMASFDPVTRRLMEEDDIDLNQKKIEALRTKKKLTGSAKKNTNLNYKKRKEVPAGKVLTAEDYLLCIRKANERPVNGYSLINSSIELQPEVIGPTIIPHHFICFRPRNDAGKFHIPFLHLMLDTITEQHFAPLINNGDKRLFKIKFLNELRVIIPTSYKLQEKAYEEYNKFRLEIIEKQDEIAKLKGLLTKDFRTLNKL